MFKKLKLNYLGAEKQNKNQHKNNNNTRLRYHGSPRRVFSRKE